MSASAFGDLTVIADPAAGGGSVGRELPALERALHERDLPYVLHVTTAPGEATRIAREALDRKAVDPILGVAAWGGMWETRPVDVLLTEVSAPARVGALLRDSFFHGFVPIKSVQLF